MFMDKSDSSGCLAAVTAGLMLLTPIPSFHFVASMIFLGLAIFYFYQGIMEFRTADGLQPASSRNPGRNPIPITTSAPVTNAPTLSEKMASVKIPRDLKCPSCGAVIRPADKKCNYCDSSLVPLIDLPEPAYFGNIQIGQAIKVAHPVNGPLDVRVESRLFYGELWQEKMRKDVPWTLTGNYYVGLWLEKNMFILNWQSRFYLLDSHTSISDMDINRDFADPARKFAASNQTLDVHFDLKGTRWHIDDIGRFRIEYGDGDEVRVGPGAVGRFIHASNKNRVLALEDFQSGGSGLDTLWTGYRIEETDVKA
jgi:hypothetical protein